MHLVQILLPLADNKGRRFDGTSYGRVRTELSERFGLHAFESGFAGPSFAAQMEPPRGSH